MHTLKMMTNPTNEGSPEAPEWWIKANMDAMVYGTGVVLVHHTGEVQHIPPEEYSELAETLEWAKRQITSQTQ